mgnify:FL=1
MAINHILRGLHDQSATNGFQDTVTMIVVTVTAGGSQDRQHRVESRIIVFGGLLTPTKGNSLLKGNGATGTMISVHWMFNQKIRRALGTNTANPGGYCYAAVKQDNLTELVGQSARNLTTQDGNRQIKQMVLGYQLLFIPNPGPLNYKLTFALSNLSPTMNFHLQTSPCCVVSFLVA